MMASSSSSSNQQWETAFVQNGQEHDNDEDDLGVPKDEVYKSHSSDIDDAVETDEVSEDSQAVRHVQFT